MQRIVGVVRDGSPRKVGGLADARQVLSVVYGMTELVDISVVNQAGVPQVLTGKTVRMVVKRQAGDAVSLVEVVGAGVAGAEPNVVRCAFAPDTFRFVKPGLFVYGVVLADGDARYELVPVSEFRLVSSVAQIL